MPVMLISLLRFPQSPIRVYVHAAAEGGRLPHTEREEGPQRPERGQRAWWEAPPGCRGIDRGGVPAPARIDSAGQRGVLCEVAPAAHTAEE
ncbi:predicted protein [Streptomyces viridosporus ATCC 14672]|uniref:Predicted protein n=1 Tax=Streptomyces viridosporus (strain ATCC 14672 / DSM 40746 / JCM 4963 / KCTC 9882 / NRRL B-12104 / FH 1290) TaxID=566461 RepID=D6A7H4_STRV1|nr:predicted protein [Streptomyces viridosporus ATCC 14672]